MIVLAQLCTCITLFLWSFYMCFILGLQKKMPVCSMLKNIFA